MSCETAFLEYCNIIAKLRAKDGCPWDREQTHASLRPCMTEEAAEFVASVRIYEETGSFENMVEELGDILLQVVMHAQIAKEEGLFDIEDVIRDTGAKMIRRHPHVFGDVNADSSEQVLTNWEEIKQKEKEGKSWVSSPLREIPQELPALRRAEKVLKKAGKVYEPQKGMEESLDEIIRCATNLKALYANSYEAETNQFLEKACEKEEEKNIADLLQSLCNVTGKRHLYAEQILSDGLEDFIRKYEGNA